MRALKGTVRGLSQSMCSREECEFNATRIAALPWKPAVQRGWPADQVEVVGFVDSQSFMDVTVRVDVCSHGAVQRQAAGREEAGGTCCQQ